MPVARYQPANEISGKPLGEPLQLTFSKRIVKNRLFKAPMTEQLATWSVPNVEARGIPTKELIELYRRCPPLLPVSGFHTFLYPNQLNPPYSFVSRACKFSHTVKQMGRAGQ